MSRFCSMCWAVFMFVLAAPPLVAQAQVAPDATATGPQAVTSSEYKLSASIDADILAGRTTELWARVYRPRTLGTGSYPLVVILHGNHATCGRGTNPRTDDRVDHLVWHLSGWLRRRAQPCRLRLPRRQAGLVGAASWCRSTPTAASTRPAVSPATLGG